MTKEQKTLILYYREQHMTYRQIGEKLGLSPDTVKTFCRRNTPQEDRTEASASSQCRNCGAPVHPLPGRRERLFCSPACRTAYWRKHNLLGKDPRYCAGCGALLTGEQPESLEHRWLEMGDHFPMSALSGGASFCDTLSGTDMEKWQKLSADQGRRVKQARYIQLKAMMFRGEASPEDLTEYSALAAELKRY